MNKRIRRIFTGMKRRCYSKNLPESTAKYYRDKGIRICDEWLNDPDAFEEWSLSHGYADDLTIDRIDSDGNYEPSNCQWITRAENTRKSSCMSAVEERRRKKEEEEAMKTPRGRILIPLLKEVDKMPKDKAMRVLLFAEGMAAMKKILSEDTDIQN